MAAADLKRILSQVLPSPSLKAQAGLLRVQNHLEMIEGSLWKINSMYMHGLMTAITKPDVEQWTNDVKEALLDVDQLLGRILRCRLPKEAAAKSPSVCGDILLWLKETAAKSPSVRGDILLGLAETAAKSPSVRGDILLGLTETASKLNHLAFGGASSLGLRAEMMDSIDADHEDFSTVLNNEVQGLEDTTNKIVKELQSQQLYEEIPTIFYIVGHEGMGKTTLARKVFHHDWVRNYFQHHVWVDSPDSFSFDPMTVARSFVEAVTKKPCGHRGYLQQLWLDVSKKLNVGRYFLVLDDVPVLMKDRDKWEQLRHVFLRLGSPGSRVVAVTSVHHSDFPEGNPTFKKLPPVLGLSRDSWTSLLRRRASALIRDDDEGKQIRKSSSAILDRFAGKLHEKSRGSPSLAKVWGSALQCTEVGRWEDQIEKDLLPKPLQDEQHFGSWSSQYLIPKDAHLYLFSSLFQQDHDEHDYEDLFHMMAAQGFIQDSSNKALIISNLKRSLRHFATKDSRQQESLTNDLIRSLPILEATQPSSESEKKVLSYWKTKGFPKSTHQLQCLHLSVLIHPSTDLTLPVTLPSKLRTLKLTMLVAENEEQKKKMEGQKIETVLKDEFSNLRHLRVLDLRATKMAEMPDTVDGLVNLRYLNLSWSDIATLPDSFCNLGSLQILKLAHCHKLSELPHRIGKLQNLQVMKLPFCENLTKLPKSVTNLIDLQELDLECCRQLVEFPDEFGNLKSLRSLSLVGCLSLTKMPSGMRQLTELRQLSGFVALQECGSCTVTELGPLKYLEDLHLRGLEGVRSTNDAEAMKLKNKRFIRNLVLHWNGDDGASSDSLLEILECLQPSTALRTLEINSYSGKDFPKWMKDGQPYHYTLTEIKLVNLRDCASLPPLGQLARLEVVEISGMVKVRKVDDEFYGLNGAFASLRKLTFSEMPELQKWVKVTRKFQLFPKLTELMIIQCPRLEQLEVELTAVKKLSLWLSNGTLLTSKSWDWSKFSGLTELEIVGCPGVKHLPKSMKILEQMVDHLTLVGLGTLESLPNWLKKDCCLDITRCGKVKEQECQNASEAFSSATSIESREWDKK
ncbi:putative disease resistance protein RGA3 [Zingiber officinale]|uniref:Uncharacterized protein n=1 Tax=Zingiber officinale TaxID=94328 RepID=A0A8J5M571_ZINOF|nr:putative disease resistance protein RGA3 [Zingiber officinale]KAG6532723.1 hypothetical protein ZIOFF_006573 [Zingiber officinale]